MTGMHYFDKALWALEVSSLLVDYYIHSFQTVLILLIYHLNLNPRTPYQTPIKHRSYNTPQ